MIVKDIEIVIEIFVVDCFKSFGRFYGFFFLLFGNYFVIFRFGVIIVVCNI